MRIIFVYKSEMHADNIEHSIIPFVPNAHFLYPLKISENLTALMFSEGRERVHLGRMDFTVLQWL